MKELDYFIWDNILKSYEIKDTLLAYSNHIPDKEKLRIIRNNQIGYNTWKIFFDSIKDKIINDVKLNYNNKKELISDVSFHPKYGWVISNYNIKAFLGKISLFENVKLYIGNRTYISGNSLIRGTDILEIGSYSSIGFGLHINASNENHPINYPASINFEKESRMVNDGLNLEIKHEFTQHKENVIIENDVWIGREVNIFNGVKIGNGCVIGARSTVTKDLEPFGVYAGTPAKLIRYRFAPKTIEQLQDIRWWDWDYSKIKSNKQFFATDLSKYNDPVKHIIV